MRLDFSNKPACRYLSAAIALVSSTLLLELAAGCSLGRTSTTEREGIDGSSKSTSVGVHLSAAEGTLARGRQAVMEGHFDDATAAFTEVVDDSPASKEHRAEALLELGRAYASMVGRVASRILRLCTTVVASHCFVGSPLLAGLQIGPVHHVVALPRAITTR